jgi:hypothetical protein
VHKLLVHLFAIEVNFKNISTPVPGEREKCSAEGECKKKSYILFHKTNF